MVPNQASSFGVGVAALALWSGTLAAAGRLRKMQIKTLCAISHRLSHGHALLPCLFCSLDFVFLFDIPMLC